jgi:hypothetical protein
VAFVVVFGSVAGRIAVAGYLETAYAHTPSGTADSAVLAFVAFAPVATVAVLHVGDLILLAFVSAAAIVFPFDRAEFASYMLFRHSIRLDIHLVA